jgi:hypothetical protein
MIEVDGRLGTSAWNYTPHSIVSSQSPVFGARPRYLRNRAKPIGCSGWEGMQMTAARKGSRVAEKAPPIREPPSARVRGSGP